MSAPREVEALRGAGRGGPPEGEREEGAQASLRVWSLVSRHRTVAGPAWICCQKCAVASDLGRL